MSGKCTYLLTRMEGLVAKWTHGRRLDGESGARVGTFQWLGMLRCRALIPTTNSRTSTLYVVMETVKYSFEGHMHCLC